jgi:hypothetical protein
VTGVVPSLKPDDTIGITGQQVNDFAFALISPLTADHDNTGHLVSPRQKNMPVSAGRRKPHGLSEVKPGNYSQPRKQSQSIKFIRFSHKNLRG